MGKKKNLYEEIWNRLVGKRIYVFCERISYSRHESHSSGTSRTSSSFTESFTGPILIVGKLIDHDNICIALDVESVEYPSSSNLTFHLNHITAKDSFVVIRKSEIKMFGAYYEDVPYYEVFEEYVEEDSEEEYLPELDDENEEEESQD